MSGEANLPLRFFRQGHKLFAPSSARSCPNLNRSCWFWTRTRESTSRPLRKKSARCTAGRV